MDEGELGAAPVARDRSVSRPRSRPLLIPALAERRWRMVAMLVAGVWLAVTIDVVRRWQQLAMGDFETYWMGARSLLDGTRLYPQSQLEGPFVLGDAAFGRGYVYPPTAALLSTPLATVSMPAGFAVFTMISALALIAVAYAIARQGRASRRIAGVIAVAVAGTGPGLDALLTGNINALAAAALGSMWLWPRWSGYLATLGGLVKVYPAIGLAWAFRGRWPISGPLLLGAAIVAVSVAVLGADAWADFRQTMANGVSTEYFPIQSPRSLLAGPLGPAAAGAIASVLTVIALLAVVRLRDDRYAFLVLGLAFILPAPDWHLHYFVVPVVAALPVMLRAGSAPVVREGTPGRRAAAPRRPG